MQRTKSTHRVGAPVKSLVADSSLNDDSAEKRQRREERVANKHLERKKVVAAATHGSPLRNPNSTPTSPPRTPNGTVLQAVEGPHTPVRKVPILANFEEWMKMATDNVWSFIPLTKW
jgi:condensin complex subunit 2